MQEKNMGHICPMGRSRVNYLRSVLNIITRYYQYTVAHCQLFLSKGNWKERKTSGAW